LIGNQDFQMSKYYIYELKLFYVGEGTGERMYAHEKEAKRGGGKHDR
jgi:hypothetical protein